MQRWKNPVSKRASRRPARLARSSLRLSCLLLPLLASACFDSSSPDADSETHFLVACEDSCGDGLSCICGVCTAACDPARDCSGQSDAASCVPLGAFESNLACEGEDHPDNLSVCELDCTTDADCQGLSSAHRCDAAGRCRAPAPGGSAPGPDGGLPGGRCSYNGQVYENGEQFMCADKCNGCGCRDGVVSGGGRVCGCVYEGQARDVGDSFPASDGCNTCTCELGGELSCTEIACPVGGDTCEYDGQTHMPGDSFPATDGCNTCTCDDDGSVSCTDVGCPTPDEKCVYDGVTYRPGDSFPSTDGCNTCTCAETGLVACTLRACIPDPVGDGGSCRVGDTTYPDGSADVPDPFSCNTCTCSDGRLDVCTEIACEEACPPTAKPGTSCAQCGPADACEVTLTGCLPVCDTDDDCPPEYFFCKPDGYCANLCG